MGASGGVEVRPTSIRITFTHEGKAHKRTLKTAGQPIPPSPGNIKYAHRLADEIRQKIRFGTFNMADYFPDDGTSGTATTTADSIDLWLKLQSDTAPSTLKGYRIAADWWKSMLGSKPVAALVHSDILGALASQPTWSGKTRNNKVSVLRQALQLAMRDGVIKSDPIGELQAAGHQRPEPDPFSVAEVEAILTALRERYGDSIANYFGFKFYTGLRTSESLAIQWGAIDWPSQTMVVSEAIVLGEHLKRTKTKTVRQVQLNTRAMDFLRSQKAISFMLPEGWIFPDPKTQKRWVDDWSPRRMYWEPILKKLGLRYRSPYQTRHTYATMLLMAGVTPAYAARQMGHSIQMFLSTYARWLDGGQNAVEMGKLEALIGGSTPPSKNTQAA